MHGKFIICAREALPHLFYSPRVMGFPIFSLLMKCKKLGILSGGSQEQEKWTLALL
jgi:hypothetical protein